MYFITLHLFYFILLTCLGSPHGSRVSCWQVTMISLISWNTRNIPKHLCPQCLFMSSWDLSRPCLLTSGMVAGLSGAHEAGTRSVSHTAKHKMCNNCHLHPLALIIQLFLTLSGQRSFSPNGSLQAYVMRRSHLVKYWFQTMADLQALALCCGGPEPSTPTSSACQNTVNAMQYKSHWMWDKQSLK